MEGKEIVEVLCEIDFGTVLLLFVFWEITGVKASSFFFSFFCLLLAQSQLKHNKNCFDDDIRYYCCTAPLLFLEIEILFLPLARPFFLRGGSLLLLLYFTIRVGERLWALSLLLHTTSSSSSHSGCSHTTQEVRRRFSHVCPSVSAHSLKQR